MDEPSRSPISSERTRFATRPSPFSILDEEQIYVLYVGTSTYAHVTHVCIHTHSLSRSKNILTLFETYSGVSVRGVLRYGRCRPVCKLYASI